MASKTIWKESSGGCTVSFAKLLYIKEYWKIFFFKKKIWELLSKIVKSVWHMDNSEFLIFYTRQFGLPPQIVHKKLFWNRNVKFVYKYFKVENLFIHMPQELLRSDDIFFFFLSLNMRHSAEFYKKNLNSRHNFKNIFSMIFMAA